MTTLAEAIAGFSESDSHYTVFDTLRNQTTTEPGLATSGDVMAFLAGIETPGVGNKFDELVTLVETSGHALENETVDIGDGVSRRFKGIARTMLETIRHREGFNFANPGVTALASTLYLTGFLSLSQTSALINKGDKTRARYPGLALRQVIAARDANLATSGESNIVTLANQRYRRQVLVVELQQALPEAVNLVYQVRHRFGADYGPWEGSSLAGLTNKQWAGTYSAVLPGECIRANDVQVKVLCSYNVGLSLSVEAL